VGCTKSAGLAVVCLTCALVVTVLALAELAFTAVADAALGDAVLAPAGAAMARNETVATAATAATDSLAGKPGGFLLAR